MIKNLKPGGKYKSGDFRDFKPKKYVGDFSKPIWYRSSYELRFMRNVELNPNVLSWNSENIEIPYMLTESVRDKSGKITTVRKKHRYYMDFEVHMKDGKKILCEVKPLAFVPLNESQIRKSPEHYKNANKWKAAIEWCKRNGYIFEIVTEEKLGLSLK